MSPQQVESLLILIAVLFIGVSFHTIRLWLKIQGINRSSQVVVVQPVSPIPAGNDGIGCLITMLWLVLIILIISIFVV